MLPVLAKSACTFDQKVHLVQLALIPGVSSLGLEIPGISVKYAICAQNFIVCVKHFLAKKLHFLTKSAAFCTKSVQKILCTKVICTFVHKSANHLNF